MSCSLNHYEISLVFEIFLFCILSAVNTGIIAFLYLVCLVNIFYSFMFTLPLSYLRYVYCWQHIVESCFLKFILTICPVMCRWFIFTIIMVIYQYDWIQTYHFAICFICIPSFLCSFIIFYYFLSIPSFFNALLAIHFCIFLVVALRFTTCIFAIRLCSMDIITLYVQEPYNSTMSLCLLCYCHIFYFYICSELYITCYFFL